MVDGATSKPWQYEGYERASYWTGFNKIPLYIGRFWRYVEDKNGWGWEKVAICFHSNHPRKAMRHILKSGLDPQEFAGKEIEL